MSRLHSNPGRIVIAGGSGFIGRALSVHLAAAGHDVVVLSRSPGHSGRNIRTVQWDGKALGPWAQGLEEAAAVINLAGKNVNCRYTKAARREMDDSRVDSVNVMAAAIDQCRTPPRLWIQASTTAIYGDAGDVVCDESSPPGRGYPVQTAMKWEAAFHAHPSPHTRRVLLRMSFVLARGGGALCTLERLTRCFMGSAVGTGRQYISWIHLADLLRIFDLALQSDLDGLICATGPNPVTNAQFMGELRHALHRPWAPRLPTWAAYVGSFFLRTEAMLALTGRRVIPRRLQAMGFAFDHPQLAGALREIYGTTARAL